MTRCQVLRAWDQHQEYPGCSSQLKAFAANYLTSVDSMGKTLDVKLTPIPDGNCCSASISYAAGNERERLVMNARNWWPTPTRR